MVRCIKSVSKSDLGSCFMRSLLFFYYISDLFPSLKWFLAVMSESRLTYSSWLLAALYMDLQQINK